MRSVDIKYIVSLIDIPLWFYISSAFIVIVVAVITKKWTVGLFVGYILIIMGETVLFRTPFNGQHYQPHLFWSYEAWKTQRRQIIVNILVFIPLGAIAGRLWQWKGIIAGVVLSISVELLQWISKRGLFEFDDILHNTLGTFIGVSIYVLVETVIKKKGNNNGLQK